MKQRQGLLKFTVLIITFANVADLVIIPAVGGFMSSFPNATAQYLDAFLVYPMFFALIGALSCGYLAQFFSKKHMLVVAYIIFTISSLGGALIDNLIYVLVMRQFVGLMFGFIGTLAMGIISELFADEKTCSFLMGVSQSSTTLMGAALTFVSGFIAVQDWHLSYYLYLISIPILLLTIIVVPKTAPEGEKASEDATEKKRMPWGKFLPFVLAAFAFHTLFNLYFYYAGIYVEEMNLGNSSVTGTLTMMIQIGMFIIGLIFSQIYIRAKRGTPIIFIFVAALMYWLLNMTSNLILIYAISAFGGTAYSMSTSYYYMHATKIVPENLMTMGMSFISSAMLLGGFAASFARILYQSVLKVDSLTDIFPYVAATLIIGGIVSIIMTVRERNAISVQLSNDNIQK